MEALTHYKKKLLYMYDKEKNGQILIFEDPNEFLKVMEEIQAQYLARHENGVGDREK